MSALAGGLRRHVVAGAVWLAALAAGIGATVGDVERGEGARRRLRDLGIVVGRMAPGPLNAITDVKGVRVGHVTIRRGEGALRPGEGPVRTGVTAILPHGGDLWREKVPAATWVLNGTGEMTGSIWIATQGALEVPILLTNTMNVGKVMDGVVAYMVKRYPDIGIEDDVVAPTVAECDDSTLNDARGRHVSVEDTVRAIEEAREGPVAEGAVGAGTGMIAYRFKGGIGTASRVVPADKGGFTVGVLVNANMGRRHELTVAGVPVGREIIDLMPEFPARKSAFPDRPGADGGAGPGPATRSVPRTGPGPAAGTATRAGGEAAPAGGEAAPAGGAAATGPMEAATRAGGPAATGAMEGVAAEEDDRIGDGSIIVVVATDAPLDHLKLQRLASKAALGLARTGTISNHGSGDIFLAFSTGNRVPHYPKPLTYSLKVVADAHLDPLFEGAQEAAEEAILNALAMATTTVGRDATTVHALPLDRLVAIMKAHGRLK